MKIYCSIMLMLRSNGSVAQLISPTLLAQYAVDVQVETLSMKLNCSFPNWERRDNDYVIFHYGVPKYNLHLKFFRNGYNETPDTVEFLQKRYLVQGDTSMPFSMPKLDMHGAKQFYKIAFKNKTYFCFKSYAMGATGSGSDFSILLLFTTLPKRMQFLVARHFKVAHLIDYNQDGELDLIYYNPKRELILFNLDTGRSKRMK